MKGLFFYLYILVLTISFPLNISAEERIKLATTTSVENSGILYELLAPFERRYNIKVDVISSGTGKALKLGEHGDVDAVLVHAPELEKEFMEAGFGLNREELMYNYFTIVGPEGDPADIKKAANAVDAFERIYKNQSIFVSRGDNSGTHNKEKKLWSLSNLNPDGKWYLETGQGMGATLQIADEKEAYCLVDRGTYIAYKNRIGLAPLFEKEKNLLNVYSIIAVNPNTKYRQVKLLIDWLVSPKAQGIIQNYKINGERLFYSRSESRP